MPAEVTAEKWREGELVAVLVPRPVGGPLDYLAPPGGVEIGQLVEVPLGSAREIGLVWGPGQGGLETAKLKSVLRTLDASPIGRSMREFLRQAASYTLTPLPSMFRMATRAPGIRDPRPCRSVLRPTGSLPEKLTPARKRVLDLFDRNGGMPMTGPEIRSLTDVSSGVIKGLADLGALSRESVLVNEAYPPLDFKRAGFDLSPEQSEAAEELRSRVRSGEFSTVLLKGVTGSGKTEVYLEAVAAALKGGRQVLVLLPEIALTAEFIGRVTERFGGEPGEWHSEVTAAERRRLWRAAGDGTVQLVVGARSALFLPFRNLGLIVVDEEHDSSYKQEDGVLYSARDMAVLRASLCGALSVLASATPSLESWKNAEDGKYGRVDLPVRAGAAEMPEIVAIDLRAAQLERGKWISGALAHAVRETLAQNRQALLFLNRRGYAPLTVCRSCGLQLGCSDCDARLVEHRFARRLMCHMCGQSMPVPERCPNCGAEDDLTAVGPGVERLAQEALELFPEARIELLSSDFSGTVAEFRHRLETVRQGGTDIIIGTQIIAKGHNFPLLGLVGAIDADLGLHGTDLRAAERTFQLMTQVAGRAGRTGRGGRGAAFLQTWQPDHPVIEAIVSGNDEEFWAAEAAERRVAGAPPCGRFAGIILSGPAAADLEKLGWTMVRNAEPLRRIGAQIFGPAPAPVARVRGRFRYRLLIKAERRAPLQRALKDWHSQFDIPANIRTVIDIDPQSFM